MVSIQHKTTFLFMALITLTFSLGCGRRSRVRDGYIPLPREINPISSNLTLSASPSSAKVGETISVEATYGDVTAFDFEFAGTVPAGVTFLDNQSGFKSVRITSSVAAQNITVRARPTGEAAPIQEVEISFYEEVDLTPTPVPPLRCHVSSLTGDRSQVGASGIFQISELSQNMPLRISRIWTSDVCEQGYFWGGSLNHATLRFRTPGYKTIFIEASSLGFYGNQTPQNCIAQTNVFVAVPHTPVIWWVPPSRSPSPTPTRLEYRWISTQGGSCSSVCQQAGMVSTPYIDGNYCASGEVRPAGVSGISYSYGAWGSGTEFTSGQSIGRYCYGSKPGKNQKQDNDRTDITVACYCRTQLN